MDTAALELQTYLTDKTKEFICKYLIILETGQEIEVVLRVISGR